MSGHHMPPPPLPDAGRVDVDRLLTLVRTHLGVEVAWLSAHAGEDHFIVATSGDAATMNISIGARIDPADSYCAHVVAGTLPAVITDARRHHVTRELPVTRAWRIGSYVGVPWSSPDGTAGGMLCCASRHRDPTLDDSARQVLAFAADLIGTQLAGPEARARSASGQTAGAVRSILDRRAVDMAFQPVLRLHDGAEVAVEALARFDRDMFDTPDKAFAAATRSGLGVALEHMAIQRAFEYRSQLSPGSWLGVNLSAEALLTPNVQETLLANAGRRIGVEITEHTQVSSYLELVAVTDRLRAAGVQIVVDDAGAGFASLSHILQLRPDVIKLDIGLVRGLDGDPVRRALTRSLVAFAAETGAALIAEGIETPAEHEALRHLEVGFGQGYLLGRPALLPTAYGAGSPARHVGGDPGTGEAAQAVGELGSKLLHTGPGQR